MADARFLSLRFLGFTFKVSRFHVQGFRFQWLKPFLSFTFLGLMGCAHLKVSMADAVSMPAAFQSFTFEWLTPFLVSGF